MRRLILVLAAIALLAPASAGAESKKPYPRVIVKSGTVRLSGRTLVGSVLMINDGRKRSGREDVELGIGTGRSSDGQEIPRLLQRLHVKPLKVKEKQRIPFDRLIPASVLPGKRLVNACVNGGTCRQLGFVNVPAQPAPGGGPPVYTPASPTSRSEPNPPSGLVPASLEHDVAPPISTVPTDPIAYDAGTPFQVTGGAVPYWAFVPKTYDPSNLTPAPLLIWLHGCGGESAGDIWTVDPGASGGPQDWLTIAVGGREGGCWSPSADEAKVMGALADVQTHFNVNRRRVVLAGYSSGGDLAYRTGFRHSTTFQGLLIENSSPFRDTESNAAESLSAATTRLPIVHLAHTGDTTYPIAGVRQEVGEVKAAGFPIELIERPGTHYDSHTDSDLIDFLLPYIDGWWPS